MELNESLIEMPIILLYILQTFWNEGYKSDLIIKVFISIISYCTSKQDYL